MSSTVDNKDKAIATKATEHVAVAPGDTYEHLKTAARETVVNEAPSSGLGKGATTRTFIRDAPIWTLAGWLDQPQKYPSGPGPSWRELACHGVISICYRGPARATHGSEDVWIEDNPVVRTGDPTAQNADSPNLVNCHGQVDGSRLGDEATVDDAFLAKLCRVKNAIAYCDHGRQLGFPEGHQTKEGELPYYLEILFEDGVDASVELDSQIDGMDLQCNRNHPHWIARQPSVGEGEELRAEQDGDAMRLMVACGPPPGADRGDGGVDVRGETRKEQPGQAPADAGTQAPAGAKSSPTAATPAAQPPPPPVKPVAPTRPRFPLLAAYSTSKALAREASDPKEDPGDIKPGETSWLAKKRAEWRYRSQIKMQDYIEASQKYETDRKRYEKELAEYDEKAKQYKEQLKRLEEEERAASAAKTPPEDPLVVKERAAAKRQERINKTIEGLKSAQDLFTDLKLAYELFTFKPPTLYADVQSCAGAHRIVLRAYPPAVFRFNLFSQSLLNGVKEVETIVDKWGAALKRFGVRINLALCREATVALELQYIELEPTALGEARIDASAAAAAEEGCQTTEEYREAQDELAHVDQEIKRNEKLMGGKAEDLIHDRERLRQATAAAENLNRLRAEQRELQRRLASTHESVARQAEVEAKIAAIDARIKELEAKTARFEERIKEVDEEDRLLVPTWQAQINAATEEMIKAQQDRWKLVRSISIADQEPVEGLSESLVKMRWTLIFELNPLFSLTAGGDVSVLNVFGGFGLAARELLSKLGLPLDLRGGIEMSVGILPKLTMSLTEYRRFELNGSVELSLQFYLVIKLLIAAAEVEVKGGVRGSIVAGRFGLGQADKKPGEKGSPNVLFHFGIWGGAGIGIQSLGRISWWGINTEATLLDAWQPDWRFEFMSEKDPHWVNVEAPQEGSSLDKQAGMNHIKARETAQNQGL
ncbi:MAG: hypothetical protein HUU21_32275 [Polyangiaceae bacterium]|nr:hypothetical protein [Polyangiaceae bacterium]